jgi:hypothetical protein
LHPIAGVLKLKTLFFPNEFLGIITNITWCSDMMKNSKWIPALFRMAYESFHSIVVSGTNFRQSFLETVGFYKLIKRTFTLRYETLHSIARISAEGKCLQTVEDRQF